MLFQEMGVCLSCLGIKSQEEDYPNESQRLLNDSQMYYGTQNDVRNNNNTSQIDSEDQRRHRDNLERICQDASARLIDVSQAQVHDAAQPTALDGAIYKQVFFGHMDPQESAAGFRDVGVVNVAAMAQNVEPSTQRGPLIFDFQSYGS